jgi:hypothetical protein
MIVQVKVFYFLFILIFILKFIVIQIELAIPTT